MDTIKRDLYLKRLIERKDNGAVKIITGVRRCGKSFLLFKIFYEYLLSEGIAENQIIKVALDDEASVSLRDPHELSRYLKARMTEPDRPYYVFLDEVQFAISKEELKKDGPLLIYGVLNGLLQNHHTDVYVTGSNSRFLSSDVMTEFRFPRILAIV